MAEIPLQSGGTVNVYGEAMRWGHGLILTCWRDDEGHLHSAWIPKDNVRRLTASEWDVIEYQQCPRAAFYPLGQAAPWILAQIEETPTDIRVRALERSPPLP